MRIRFLPIDLGIWNRSDSGLVDLFIDLDPRPDPIFLA
jgi:hypothetical protein